METENLQKYLEKVSDVGINGIQVIQNGQEIGCWMENEKQRQNQFSITKSFTSAAVGFAIHEGMFNLNTLICNLFEEADRVSGSHWKDMKIYNLLTMTMGVEYPLLMGNMRMNLTEKDWVTYIFRQNVIYKPGSVFQYNNAGPYLLSVLIQRKTGQNLIEYLTPRLFERLKIEPPEGEYCPRGYVFGASGFRMNARDLGKFGRLYLQQGNWEGKQILPEKWVTESVKKHVSYRKAENLQMDGYGYLFWHLKSGIYMANGKYGQYCIVIPDKDAVISINSTEKIRNEKIYFDILEEILLFL